MIDCSRVLELYSEYRDGLLDRDSHAAVTAHLHQCGVCSRYDQVVSGGVRVLLQLPEIEPSEDFAERLKIRLASMELEDARQPHASGASLRTILAVAASMAAIAWLPTMLRPAREMMVLPAAVAHAPRHPEVVPPLFEAGPLLDLPYDAPLRARTVGLPALQVGPALGTLASYAPDPYPLPDR